MIKKEKIVLIILDGWGLAETWGGNAIALANTPVMNSLSKNFPYTTLEAAGEAVGLPFNESGNSEVGHFNMGTGQIVKQGLSAINQMISDHSFFNNKILNDYFNNAKTNTLHLVGLASDGGIHSHISHLFALLELAKTLNLKRVALHLFTDGRDASPTSGIKFIKKIEQKIAETGVGEIATISGRYYAMDRDNNWDRVEKVYRAMVLAEGEEASSPQKALVTSYSNGITDEFMVPKVINKNLKISDDDTVIFFNFRSDRARQLARTLAIKNFNNFKRNNLPKNLKIATFASYQENLPVKVIFANQKTTMTLPVLLTQNKLTHCHIAETEKYPHVTYFFNGEKESPLEGEKRILVSSPKVATYDLKPQMSANEVAEKACDAVGQFDFIVINFANADMVGHTGNFEATTTAVETVDKCLGKLIKKIEYTGSTAIITADHGNAEKMIEPVTGLPYTEHTNNPVPFVLFSKKIEKLREDGKLSEIAPTILDLYGFEKPNEMKDQSLIC